MKADLKISYPGSEKVYISGTIHPDGKTSSILVSTPRGLWNTIKLQIMWVENIVQCVVRISAL